ncbi:DNA ligase D [Saccharopolyspora erythraea NRRL 2338]|uniref:DNA ligase (ATP) n=2 Tax=Saccharopolyspora erythraea TaxID=1836 RepID=A4FLE3_SACEN|nr:non-homologous end-joining DNA ligase [Saccharopolyspora erythraea]EQD82754.1 ATP-dependent DNA ligase [Saccharopolyspora erythraea D]PFG98509.1 DNA ligase D [Saccharopolyspora erythraea NRRL 2338]QRK88559.1 non-homologous end-joining DNA ligase [Saccharopolyspora erythraea]CAM04868.1 DNA ligase, ATP-dependent [Saccharopolyspora erythraea NRRL 2338]
MTDPQALLDDDERSLLRRWTGDWAEPQLATLTDAPFSDPAWIYERKLDGMRVIAGSEGGGEPVLWSRSHRRVNTAYPEVADALAEQAADRFVVDGEVVAFEGDQTSFARLQRRIHLGDARAARNTGVRVFYYVFDVLAFGGVDLRRLPLRTRKRLLRESFDFADPLRFSAHRSGNGEEFLAQACERGWEGLIAKRADRPYCSGRSRDWLKFKCVSDQEFVIGGYTEPKGSRVGFGALLLGYYEGDRFRYAGKVGTGYDERTLRDLRARLDRIERDASPFHDRVAERDAHWVEPELVAQIGFTEWTSDGRLRHPRFSGLRNDKPAHEVVREAPA